MKENYKRSKDHPQKTSIKKDYLMIDKSFQYHGLLGFSSNHSLDFLPANSLYNFPILSSTESSKSLPISSFTMVTNLDILSMLSKHQKNSLFQLISAQNTDASIHLQEVPKNSINLCSFYSNLCSRSSKVLEISHEPIADSTHLDSFSDSFPNEISRAELSESQKQGIKSLHQNFLNNLEDEKHFQSISPRDTLSPFNSASREDSEVELTPPSVRHPSFISNSSISLQQSEEVVLESLNLELSMLEWDNKRKHIKAHAVLNTSNTGVLIGESQELDSKFLFQSREALISARAGVSIESPPEDEGSIRMSFAQRLFLNGSTASKHRLCNEHTYKLQQVPPKVLLDSQTIYNLETERNFPYRVSPLVRKLVVYEETRPVLAENRHCQILYSCPVGGFLSAPSLSYCSEPLQSFTTISNSEHPLLCMISRPILKNIMDIPIKYISCGYEHIAALSLNGRIYTWGIGSSGCLGHNNLQNCMAPEIIGYIAKKEFAMVECGGYHTVAISEGGEVWSWGRNDVFQCGVKSKKLYNDQIGSVALRPFRVKALREKVKSAACGEAHSLFMTVSGEVIGCGWGEEGQLSSSWRSNEFNRIGIPEKAVKIRCGGVFSIALSENGRVYAWGNGAHGELGMGMSAKYAGDPSLITNLAKEFIVDVCCGESQVLAMTRDKVYGWGKGIVHHFEEADKYPTGSAIICCAPVQLRELNCLQKVLIPKSENMDFNKILAEKLQKYQEV